MPRFLDTYTGQFVWAHERDVRYAILSHVWLPDGEQSYQDLCKIQAEVLQRHREEVPPGDVPKNIVYGTSILSHSKLSPKIKGFCRAAREAGYAFGWADMCCINKESSAELSEAINSMFEWYSRAHVCYVYLADVPDGGGSVGWETSFRESRWHRRGWTLQELLAPRRVVFLSSSWRFLGTKTGMATILESITQIDRGVLTGQLSLDSVGVARKMSWAASRETTRVEDQAYCLLGIFRIHMAPIYGEQHNAFLRLQEEIVKTIPDQSIFAWGYGCALPEVFKAELLHYKQYGGSTGSTQQHDPGLLAQCPADFRDSESISPISSSEFARRLALELEDLPTLNCVFTPQGVQVQLFCIDARNYTMVTRALSNMGRCKECQKGPGPTLLAFLRCSDEEGRLVALPLYYPPSPIAHAALAQRDNAIIQTHTRCDVDQWDIRRRIHIPQHIVSAFARAGLDPSVRKGAQAYHRTSRLELREVLICRYFSAPTRQPRSFHIAQTLFGNRSSIPIAPWCEAEVGALGFRLSPSTECSSELEKNVLLSTITLVREGKEEIHIELRVYNELLSDPPAPRRCTPKTRFTIAHRFNPVPATISPSHAMRPDSTQTSTSTDTPPADPYVTKETRTSQWEVLSDDPAMRAQAEAEFLLVAPIDANPSPTPPASEASHARSLRLRLYAEGTSQDGRPDMGLGYDDLWLSIELTHPFLHEPPRSPDEEGGLDHEIT